MSAARLLVEGLRQRQVGVAAGCSEWHQKPLPQHACPYVRCGLSSCCCHISPCYAHTFRLAYTTQHHQLSLFPRLQHPERPGCPAERRAGGCTEDYQRELESKLWLQLAMFMVAEMQLVRTCGGMCAQRCWPSLHCIPNLAEGCLAWHAVWDAGQDLPYLGSVRPD